MFRPILNLLLISILFIAPAAYAARDTDSYDGNIFPIYAGNGSLVPAPTTLEKSLSLKRTSVIIFYLDDSSTSKEFAPVVSGLKLVWGSAIDVLPFTTDDFHGNQSQDPQDPSYYWRGQIPQIVIIDGDGKVVLDQDGQVPIKVINEAISSATGQEIPFEVTIKPFNEYSSEPEKEGYTDPR